MALSKIPLPNLAPKAGGYPSYIQALYSTYNQLADAMAISKVTLSTIANGQGDPVGDAIKLKNLSDQLVDAVNASTSGGGTGGGTPTTIAPSYNNFKGSGINPDVVGYPRPDPLSEAVLRTPATSFTLNVPIGSGIYVHIGTQFIGFYPSGTTVISGLPAGSKDIGFNIGQQGRPYEKGDINFAYFTVTLNAGDTGYFLVPAATTEGIAIDPSDSISNGATTTYPAIHAWPKVLEALRSSTVYVMGYGSEIGTSHIDTPDKRTSRVAAKSARLAKHASKISMTAFGTNDYGFAGNTDVDNAFWYTPTQVRDALTAYLQLEQQQISGVKQFVITPPPRTAAAGGEGANALGFTMPEYRQAEADAASATGATVIPGPSVFDPQYSSDGTHQNNQGNANAAPLINNYINASGSGAPFVTSAQEQPYMTATTSQGNGESIRALVFGSTAGQPVQWRMKFASGAYTAWQDSNIFSLESISPATGIITYQGRLTSTPATVVTNTFTLAAFYAPLDANGFSFIGDGWNDFAGLPANAPFALAYYNKDTVGYAKLPTVPAGATYFLYGRKQPNTPFLDISLDEGASRTPINITGDSFASNCQLLAQGTAPAGGFTPRVYLNINSPGVQVSYVKIQLA